MNHIRQSGWLPQIKPNGLGYWINVGIIVENHKQYLYLREARDEAVGVCNQFQDVKTRIRYVRKNSGIRL
jgi:hypothetical protein